MQQVEQGKLDLDRDVNDYLDFKIPPAFGKPITLRNIMTHSTGFEETAKDLFVGSAERLATPAAISPGAHARENFSSGNHASLFELCNNHGGLHCGARFSGQNFNDYVEEHFFKPLNMNARHVSPTSPACAHTRLCHAGYFSGSGEPKHLNLCKLLPPARFPPRPST